MGAGPNAGNLRRKPGGSASTSVRRMSIRPLIRPGPPAYDAILLDVDNGPEGLTRKANDALYDLAGLSRAATLRPGGVLGV